MTKKRNKKKRSKKKNPHAKHRPSRPQWYLKGLGSWSTEDILVELKKYRLDMDEATYRQDAADCNEPSVISENWIDRVKTLDVIQQDFFQYSACELWRRFLPDKDCINLLEDDLSKYFERDPGSDSLSQPDWSEDEVAAVMGHLDRLDALLAQKTPEKDKKPKEHFDEIFGGISYDIEFWLLDLPWKLEQYGFVDEAVAVARRYSFLDPGNMLADIALILAENARCQEALVQVGENLKNLSDDGWVVIKAGEVYDQCGQPERAIALYLKAHEMTDDHFDRDGVYERLIPLYERMGMDKEKKTIEEMQAEDRAAETGLEPAVAYRLPPSKKVGRNAPCPCGSGKKYKKCCLIKA